MTNPPNFVMYVVMVKMPDGKFNPWWSLQRDRVNYVIGFQKKADARKSALDYQKIYGTKTAYVQQYGPYS